MSKQRTAIAPSNHKFCLTVGGREFIFEGKRTIQPLGTFSIRHYSLPKQTLYEPNTRGNATNLVECFWALVQLAAQGGEAAHIDNAETYLLARLMPRIHSHLANKIMPDASLGPPAQGLSAKAKASFLSTIDSTLVDVCPSHPDLADFRTKTADLLEMPHLSEAKLSIYQEICTHLLAEPATLLTAGNREEAANLLEQRWAEAAQRWYRRRRWTSPEAKAAFSMISYECRAAFHECYSDVWLELLGQTNPPVVDSGWTPEESVFHALWHVIHKTDSDVQGARFDLFHGHIFALHPATQLLLSTPQGQDVIGKFIGEVCRSSVIPAAGDLLEAVRSLPTFGAFLHTVQVAVYAYIHARTQLAQDRQHSKTVQLDPNRLSPKRDPFDD